MTENSECPHDELSNDGFGKYHYCLRCGKRVHTVMKDRFTLVRFQPCLENHNDKNNELFYENEKNCNCESVIKLGESEYLV